MSEEFKSHVSKQKPAIIQINNGALISHENIVKYLDKFIQIEPLSRYSILSEIVTRNTQSLFTFLQYLEAKNQGLYTQGMFNLLNEILTNFKELEDDSKSRIFLAALKYYQGDKLIVDDNILKDAIQLLIRSPNVKQALGLANYVVINEVETFTKTESVLKKLDESNQDILQLMNDTWDIFTVDAQVKSLIPQSLFVLNVPFIQILKTNCALALVRDIPSRFTEYFVQICAFSTSPTVFALRDYINTTRNMFLQKQEVLDQQVLEYFMSRLAQQLRSRDPSWVGKIEEIKRLQSQIVIAQVEKGIKLSERSINMLLRGDYSELQRILQLPRAIEGLSTSSIIELFEQFQTKNAENDKIKRFSLKSEFDRLKQSQTLELIQSFLGFKLYESQILCLNYIQNQLDSNHFIQFGIGNGKTLLSIALAIIIAKDINKSVFIVSKNEHLVQRDIKKYEELIRKMNLNCNLNQCSKSLGIYFFTQGSIKKQLNNGKFNQNWKDSYVIVDEYDWIFFDGSCKTIVETIKEYSQATQIIGFSGSQLSIKEIKCLELIFHSKPVIFPTLDQLKGSKKIQRTDILVTNNKEDYITFLKYQIEHNIQYCPILIVAGEKYNMIENGLKYSGYDFTSLSKTQAQTIEATIEGRYLMRNKHKQFGIYLMNESQGRGTDIQTNDEIESNGGSYLIIADVFSKRSEEQIIGRVGRLNTKGKWQRILYQLGSKDSAEQHIHQAQSVLDLQEDKKLSQVQSSLEEFAELLKSEEQNSQQSKNIEIQEEELKIDKNGEIVQPDEQIYQQNDDILPKNTEINEIDEITKFPELTATQALQEEFIKHQEQNQEISYVDLVVDKMKQLPLLKDKTNDQIKGIMIRSYQASQAVIQTQNEMIAQNQSQIKQVKVLGKSLKKKRKLKQESKGLTQAVPSRRSERTAKKVQQNYQDNDNDILNLNSESEKDEKIDITK